MKEGKANLLRVLNRPQVLVVGESVCVCVWQRVTQKYSSHSFFASNPKFSRRFDYMCCSLPQGCIELLLNFRLELKKLYDEFY